MSARRLAAGLAFCVAVHCSSAWATDSSVPFIRADQVHAQGFTGQGVTVAVVDTGIYYGHDGLSGGIADGGISFENGNEVHDGGSDIYGLNHGTYMALIITDATGVAPAAKILSVRVFGAGGGADPDDIVMGLRYVIDRRQVDPSIRVINLSLGTALVHYSCGCDFDSPENYDEAIAISRALDHGIVTFAASGNDANCGGISAPACVSDAVRVAASYDGNYPTQNFNICGDIQPPPYWVVCFSNIAEDCNFLMAAPGFSIAVGGLGPSNGTSQATAHCSGVAALLFGKAGCNPPTAFQARNIIFNSASTHDWGFPYCPLPPEPKHLDALAACNQVGASPCTQGDVNCDGSVDVADIPDFIEALLDPTGYDMDHDGNTYPVCNRTAADMNGDALVDGGDIQLFVAAIIP